MKKPDLIAQRSLPPKIITSPYGTNGANGQCDACSPLVLTRDSPKNFSTQQRYQRSPLLIGQEIDSRHHVFFAPARQSSSLLNQSAVSCLTHFSSPKRLNDIPPYWEHSWGQKHVHSLLEQMLALHHLIPENHSSSEVVEKPQSLAAWLHITDRCNLHCSYCYLPHRNITISFETGQGAIDSIFRSAVTHKYHRVKFKYAGGEPLLRFPMLTQLHQYAQRLAERHQLKLDGVIISNGTLLTKKMITEIQALGLRLTISLDNLPGFVSSEMGNAQRGFSDGRDSSKYTIQAIELALGCDLVPNISITVSGRNVDGLPDLLNWVLERNLPFSLNFYREHHCGSPLVASNLSLQEDEFISGLLAAYKVIEENLPQRSLLASLADLANFAAPHVRRCSVGHSYLVVAADGSISKCQMQMDKAVTTIQSPDPLAEIRADTQGIQNLSVDKKEECRDCQWKYWCGGGCPLESYRTHGRYDLKSPNCRIYKALYPEVLRLEGLRLLQQHHEA